MSRVVCVYTVLTKHIPNTRREFERACVRTIGVATAAQKGQSAPNFFLNEIEPSSI